MWEISGYGGRLQHRRSFWSGVLCLFLNVTSSSKSLKREGVLGFNCILSDVSTVHRPIETKILSLPISTRVAQEKEHYVSSWIRLDCPKKLLCTVLESPGPSILSKERFVVSNEGNALVIVRTQAKLVS